MVTRQVLAEEFGSAKDRALLARIPAVNEVEAVVAYGSYRNFSSERGDILNGATPGGQPVFTFGWSFFVPSSSKRSDKDLLREAVELAHADEIRTWRAAVQRWRRNTILLGKSDDVALVDMEAMIADYRRAARRLKIEVRSRWGLAVAGAAAGTAAVFVPPVGNRCCCLRARIPYSVPQHPQKPGGCGHVPRGTQALQVKNANIQRSCELIKPSRNTLRQHTHLPHSARWRQKGLPGRGDRLVPAYAIARFDSDVQVQVPGGKVLGCLLASAWRSLATRNCSAWSRWVRSPVCRERDSRWLPAVGVWSVPDRGEPALGGVQLSGDHGLDVGIQRGVRAPDQLPQHRHQRAVLACEP
jgi:hypothetical protein